MIMINRSRQFFAPENRLDTAYVSGLAVLKTAVSGFGLTIQDEKIWELTGFTGDELSAEQLVASFAQVGLPSERSWLPVDALPTLADALPLVVLISPTDSVSRYLLIWQKVGPFWQVMDPINGRRWLRTKDLQKQLQIHSAEHSFEDMEVRFNPEAFATYIEKRLQRLHLAPSLIDDVLDNMGDAWQDTAVLDAVVRFLHDLVDAGSLRRGKEAARVFRHLLSKERSELMELVPEAYWTFRRGTVDPHTIHFKGLSVISVVGPETAVPKKPPKSPRDLLNFSQMWAPPEQIIWQVLREDGWLAPASVVLGLLVASMGLTVEIFFLQGLLQLGQQLSNTNQRATMLAALIFFFITLLILLVAIDSLGRQQGRRIEVRLRIAFLEKIPRLPIWFFLRTQVSSLTQRGYTLRSVHVLPDLAQKFLQTGFQIVFTAVGLIWLEPSGAPIVILLVLLTVVWPYLTQPMMAQNSFGLAQETNNLSRIYLDALLGVVPVRVHSAEDTVWRRHQSMLVSWGQANLNYFNFATVVQVTGLLLTTTLMVGIILNYVWREGELGAILLVAFWATSIPMLGQRLVDSMQEYLQKRAYVQMIMQPLSIPDAVQFPETLSVTRPPDANPDAVRIELRDVVVAVDDVVILHGIDLDIAAGEQVAIVGLSGAGKSTLASVLLGWQTAVSGEVLIDGISLEGEYIELLRRETAWIDPAVQLWNRTLLYNLWYANQGDMSAPIGEAVEQADLFDVLEALPEGLQTMLGENGRLLSGGQGQRVRLGRAMLQEDVRLVVMDEPFRGLDRDKRSLLLTRAREFWPNATMVCITHDVGETENFSRVLVLEDGNIIQDGSPEELKNQKVSRYRDLLEAEEAVRRTLWESADWKRLYLADGKLTIGERDEEQDSV